MIYLKKATHTAETGRVDVRSAVQTMLDEIERGGDEAARRFARDFDHWEGDIVVPRDRIEAAARQVPEKLKDDIRFAHGNIRRFAEAQLATVTDCRVVCTSLEMRESRSPKRRSPW